MARRTTRRRLTRDQMSVRGEAEYIISRALAHVTTIVTLGPLVFFSTETGDAWMLDPDDGLALCLATDGCAQPWRIEETRDAFSIEWRATYQLDGEIMTVVEYAGRSRSIAGYPIDELRRAIRRTQARHCSGAV